MEHTFKTFAFERMKRLYDEPVDITDFEDLYRELDFPEIIKISEEWGDLNSLKGYENGVIEAKQYKA
tara:strand:- start:1054 stop:1254 length:201 start_codon:yes stop_codon:yes gene_type:complete